MFPMAGAMSVSYSDSSSQVSDTSYNRRLAAIRRYIGWIQVFFYLAVVLFAIFTTISLTITQWDLQWNCPLYSYAGPKLVLIEDRNNSIRLRVDNILFGDTKTCLYTTYLNLTGGTYALIWGIMIMVLKRPRFNKKRYTRKLLFPSLLFNSILFTSEVISSCVLTLGFTYWCRKLKEDVGHGYKHDVEFTCQYLQNLPWDTTNRHVQYMRSSRLFALLTFAQFSSWILTFCTFVLSGISGERFYKAIWFGESNLQRRRYEAAMQHEAQGNGPRGHGWQGPSTNGNAMKTAPQVGILPGSRIGPPRGNGRLLQGVSKVVREPAGAKAAVRPQQIVETDNEEVSEALLTPASIPETVSVQSGGFHSDASPLLAQSPTAVGGAAPMPAVTQTTNSSKGSDVDMEMISTV